jgi:hypothetical protein
VADTEEAEIASLLRDSHGICHAEIRVADHAENGVDTPSDHGVDEHVRHCSPRHGFRRQCHVHTIGALLSGETRRSVRKSLGRLPRNGVVVVAMPGAPQPAAFDGPLAEWTLLMWAVVVEAAVLAFVVRKRERSAPNSHRHHPALLEFVGLGNLVPGQVRRLILGACVCAS